MAHSIVFLHGFFQDGRVFDPLKNVLQKDGFEVFTPDLPGFGQHSQTDLSSTSQVEWLKNYLIELKKEKLTLVAYSMGARLLLQAMKEVQSLVDFFICESGTNGIQDDKERLKRSAYDSKLAQLALTDFNSFQELWMNHPTLKPIQVLCFDDLLRLKLIQTDQKVEHLAQSLTQFGTGTMPFLSSSYFEAVTKPVLFMAGKNDVKFAHKAQELASFNNLFKSILIDECGHRIHLEKPKTYLETIKSFISRN